MSVDPTKTTTLRGNLATKLHKMLVESMLEVLKLMDMGLAFNSLSPDQINAMVRWLDSRIKSTNADAELKKAVSKAYGKAAARTHTRSKRGMTGPNAGAELKGFMESFKGPETLNKLETLYQSFSSDVKGLTDQTLRRIRNIMADGVIKKQTKKEIVAEVTKHVKKLPKWKIQRIVNTNIVKVSAEGALDAMERLGVVELTVSVEWSTAKDSKVCPKCKPLGGMVLTIKKARGMFPVHPNCRCMPIPAPNKKPTTQRVLKSRVRQSLKSEPRKSKWRQKAKSLVA